MSTLRREFKVIESQEKAKIAIKKIKILAEKYRTNRQSFWKEIDSRKCRSPTMNVEHNKLVEHYTNLFGAEPKNIANREFDEMYENELKRMIEAARANTDK